jgi:hypothetical protein
MDRLFDELVGEHLDMEEVCHNCELVMSGLRHAFRVKPETRFNARRSHFPAITTVDLIHPMVFGTPSKVSGGYPGIPA